MKLAKDLLQTPTKEVVQIEHKGQRYLATEEDCQIIFVPSDNERRFQEDIKTYQAELARASGIPVHRIGCDPASKSFSIFKYEDGMAKFITKLNKKL